MSCCSMNDDVPDAFICPLTLEIMVDPVMNRSGQSYERSAIVEWLRKENATCPLTRKPIKISDFVANRRLQQTIMAWRKEQGDDVSDDSSSETSIDAIIQNLPIFGSITSIQKSMERSKVLRRSKVPSALRRYHLLQ